VRLISRRVSIFTISANRFQPSVTPFSRKYFLSSLPSTHYSPFTTHSPIPSHQTPKSPPTPSNHSTSASHVRMIK
jgi:hypothetical protein